MTEAHIAFLCKIASNICNSHNPNYTLLRSHYLMKCKEATGGYGLPTNKFSPAVRCPRCFLEWAKGTPIKYNQSELSKRQRKRLNRKKNKFTGRKLEDINTKLRGNKLEKTCTFCNYTSVTNVAKPERQKIMASENKINMPLKMDLKSNKVKNKLNNKNKSVPLEKEVQKLNTTNVYTNAYDVFSLKNEKNTLKSGIKEPAKVIKNNKKRKDKFAGLCQTAVLAAAKIKEEKSKQNKLGLFLKPSSG